MCDYESVAKSLQCCASDSEPCEHCNCELEECNPKTIMEIAADAIEELLTAVPKWNPASKPPKENGRYYVAYEDSVSFLDYFNGKWFFPPRNGIVVEETKESILYWQPFPAPPKEVQDG